jgi:hypothetical protein
MVTLDSLVACMAWPGARYPQTAQEWRLIGVLVFVGMVLAACFFGPLVRNFLFLERQRKNRGERGRALLERMVSPTGFPSSNTMGLSLRGQDLRGEDLKDAFLDDVDLSDTDLRGVDLSGASLDGAHLAGARYDAQTRWPEGFDPAQHGAVRAE